MNAVTVKTGDVSLDRKCYQRKAGYSVSKACIEDECGGQIRTDL